MGVELGAAARWRAVGGLIFRAKVDEHGSASIGAASPGGARPDGVETVTTDFDEVRSLGRLLIEISEEMESRATKGRKTDA